MHCECKYEYDCPQVDNGIGIYALSFDAEKVTFKDIGASHEVWEMSIKRAYIYQWIINHTYMYRCIEDWITLNQDIQINH